MPAPPLLTPMLTTTTFQAQKSVPHSKRAALRPGGLFSVPLRKRATAAHSGAIQFARSKAGMRERVSQCRSSQCGGPLPKCSVARSTWLPQPREMGTWRGRRSNATAPSTLTLRSSEAQLLNMSILWQQMRRSHDTPKRYILQLQIGPRVGPGTSRGHIRQRKSRSDQQSDGIGVGRLRKAIAAF